MRHFIKTAGIAALSLTVLFQTVSYAQEAGQKTARQIKRELYRNVDKTVRKEVKKLEKEGWKTMDLPLEKQLERTWEREIQMDDQGYPKYVYVTTEAVAKTFSVAQMEAQNVAMIRIAGAISSSVASLADVALQNNQIDATTANSLSKANEKAKVLVSGKLGRLINSACMYKVDSGTYTVRMTVLYDMKQSMKLLLDAIEQNLSEGDMEQVKSILGMDSLINQYEKNNNEQ